MIFILTNAHYIFTFLKYLVDLVQAESLNFNIIREGGA
jgi:hypothetical protein